MWGQRFSQQQWMVLTTLMVGNLFNGMCFALQAPFYPPEAEKRGIQKSEYGSVMGIPELAIFFVSPIIGNNLRKLGMKRTLSTSFGMVGVSITLFGTLGYVEDGRLFLAFSYILRIIEGCGSAGLYTASFSFIVKYFPANSAPMFGLLETFSGLGMVLGPFLGGLLYETGGFTLPFSILGSGLIVACIFSICVLPHPQMETEINNYNRATMLKALKIPGITFALLTVLFSAMGIGQLTAMLAPYLSLEFGMSVVDIAYIWVPHSIAYGIAAPITGIICQKYPPYIAACSGIILTITLYGLIGPLPFLTIPQSKALTVSTLVLIGIAAGIQNVSGFAAAFQQALMNDFPNGIETHAMVSGLLTCFFALGFFIGPTIGGLLSESVGFPWSTLLIVCPEMAILIILIAFVVFWHIKYKNSVQNDIHGEFTETDRLLCND